MSFRAMVAAPTPSRVRMAAAVLVVGLAAAAAAVGFREALYRVYAIVLGDRNVLRGVAALPWWACILFPAIGGAVATMLVRFAKGGSSGVGGVMEAVTLGRGRISFRSSVARVLACFAAVAGGGSIGREGPIIQLGAGIGDAMGRRAALTDMQSRVLVAAGTAAGFAAAYGTPLAALLFVIEIVTVATSASLVAPLAVAAVIAKMVTGLSPLYGDRSFAVGSMLEIAACAALGLAGGMVGAGFVRMLERAEDLFRKIPGPVALRAAIGGAIAGAIAIRIPEVAGNGYEAIQRLLELRMPVAVLAIMLVAKAVATTASVSSGAPGGVFTPALFIGAALGRLVASGLEATGVHTDPGAFAVVGMAATCAATTHAPLMASALLLELTNDSALILPILLSATAATLCSRRIHPHSLYTGELIRRRLAWPDRFAVTIHKGDADEPDIGGGI